MLYFIKSRLPEIDTSLAQVPGFTSPMRIKSSIVSPKKKKARLCTIQKEKNICY